MFMDSNNIFSQDAIDEEEKEALHDYMTAKLRQYLMRTGGGLPLPYSQNDIPEYENSLGKWFNEPVSADEEGITEQGMLTVLLPLDQVDK